MIASIDVEDAHTGKVLTLKLPIIEHIENKLIKFDIRSLSKENLELLDLAISEKKDFEYTDIEMIFIDDDPIPYFGTDYNFFIKDNQMFGYYNRELHPRNGWNNMGWFGSIFSARESKDEELVEEYDGNYKYNKSGTYGQSDYTVREREDGTSDVYIKSDSDRGHSHDHIDSFSKKLVL